jgi:GNAT superfamily N-acetyltransferase
MSPAGHCADAGAPPSLRDATTADFDFAFSAKREAMGPHIEARWGWDGETQLRFHHDRWSSRPWQIILLGDERVGTVSLDWQADHLQFGEFYLLQRHQRRGIGSQVLQDALHKADHLGLATRLEYLKWNPVASLYARHGFKRMDENGTHYFLVRPPKAA